MTDLNDHRALADYHIHVTAGRGKDPRMTVRGIVRRSKELGRREVGLLEHLAPLRGRPIEALDAIREEIARIEDADGVRAWFSAELEATESGECQGPPDVRKRLGLDYAIGAIHAATKGLDPDEFAGDHLRRMLAMLEGPVRFEVMAHPWRSVLTQISRKRGIEKPGFEVIPESMQRELIDACRAQGVAIEVNAGSPLEDPAHDAFLLRAAAAGPMFAIGSDAHHFESLDHADRCAGTLTRLGIDDRSLWRP